MQHKFKKTDGMVIGTIADDTILIAIGISPQKTSDTSLGVCIYIDRKLNFLPQINQKAK